MLQQTTVTTVIPFYKRFLKKWPNLKSFFNATLEEVLYEWQGLGYYQRAKNLFKAKEFLKSNKLVIDSKNLINIPGIGEYTSCSISAILKDESCAVVDGNIERIMLRVFGLNRSEKYFKKKIKFVAQKLTPLKNNKYYCQSLMDLANMICKSQTPDCVLCPIKKFCKSNGSINFEPKKKIKRSTKAGIIFLVKFENKFLVGKSKKKILQGLYEFPTSEYLEYKEVEEREKIYKYQMKEWKNKNKISENLNIINTFEHNFSHFQLKVLVVEIILKRKIKLNDFFWFSMNELKKKPISKLMSKVLQNII
jgi:A/G-specific adenine glycosylase